GGGAGRQRWAAALVVRIPGRDVVAEGVQVPAVPLPDRAGADHGHAHQARLPRKTFTTVTTSGALRSPDPRPLAPDREGTYPAFANADSDARLSDLIAAMRRRTPSSRRARSPAAGSASGPSPRPCRFGSRKMLPVASPPAGSGGTTPDPRPPA